MRLIKFTYKVFLKTRKHKVVLLLPNVLIVKYTLENCYMKYKNISFTIKKVLNISKQIFDALRK